MTHNPLTFPKLLRDYNFYMTTATAHYADSDETSEHNNLKAAYYYYRKALITVDKIIEHFNSPQHTEAWNLIKKDINLERAAVRKAYKHIITHLDKDQQAKSMKELEKEDQDARK